MTVRNRRHRADERAGDGGGHAAERPDGDRAERHGLELHGGDADVHAERCAGGGASYPAMTVTVNVASTAPASVTNTATVSGGGQTNTANDSASDVTTITPVPVANLTVTKTHAGTLTQGQTGATYTVTVRNSGTGPTSGLVTVVDTLPSGLTATGAERHGLELHAGDADVHAERCAGGRGELSGDHGDGQRVASTAPASVTNRRR